MTLQQLECFAEAARENTFAKAAQKMCMTQPAFSMAIRNLENDLNVVLFCRNNKGVSLTDSGRKLYPYITYALDVINEGKKAVAMCQSDVEQSSPDIETA